jgi:uncharacterized protein (DUF433 family)
MAQPIVTSSPDILSGAPVFAGTRVPVQALIDYLEGGQTIDEFLAGFPTVARPLALFHRGRHPARSLESGRGSA